MRCSKKLFVFMLIQIQMMGFVLIPSGVVKTVLLLTLCYTVIKGRKKENVFTTPLKWFFFFCFVNMLSCYYFRGQTPLQFLIGRDFTNMLPIFVVFAIPAFNLSDEKVEKTLTVLCSFFVCCYLLQYLVYPMSIFVNGNEDAIASNARPRIPGQALLSLAFFYHLGKVCDKWRWNHVCVTFLSLLCLLILGFRSQLAVLVVVTGIYIIKRNRLSGKLVVYIILGILGLFAMSQTPIAQNKINQIMDRNETQNFDNDDYVRIRTYNYYTQIAPYNQFERIMGIGLPNPNCKYGRVIQELKEHHIVWADWGLLGMAWVLGYPGTLCIIWYALYAFGLKVDKRYYYLKYWFLFMVLCSVFTREIYRDGAFAIQGIVLYLLSQAHKHYMLFHPYERKYGL